MSSLLIVAAARARAQSPAPSPRPSAPPCSAPQHRQFDFWVGTWDVRGPKGGLAGTNTITREYGGCVILERYTGTQGYTGSSFNIYDATTGRWHQTWVDSSGTLLLLDGEFKDGKMQMAGETVGAGGAKTRHTITWEPKPDGSLRQLWQSSSDAGKTWSVVFDGVYGRKAN